jgi:broad specificity phosphatase PhoE
VGGSSHNVRLLLIRHGETDDNAGRLALGRRDVPLNERGRTQAQNLAGALAERFEIAAIYSSPLQRALATARPLADELRLDIAIEPALIEMDIGELESLPFDVVRARYPDFMKRWLSDELADAIMPGGESLRQVQERAWPAVEAILERHRDELVAIVSHNFVILTLLCRVLDVPLAQFRRLRQDLAAFSLVELTADRRTLLRLNDRCHLG